MFNLGFTELLLLGVIALIFIGPNQLPEVARTVGRLLNEWRRATSDFQSTVTSHLTEDVQGRWNEARLQNADSAEANAGHGPEAHDPNAHVGHEHDPHAHPVSDSAVALAANHGDGLHEEELPPGALPIADDKDKKS